MTSIWCVLQSLSFLLRGANINFLQTLQGLSTPGIVNTVQPRSWGAGSSYEEEVRSTNEQLIYWLITSKFRGNTHFSQRARVSDSSALWWIGKGESLFSGSYRIVLRIWFLHSAWHSTSLAAGRSPASATLCLRGVNSIPTRSWCTAVGEQLPTESWEVERNEGGQVWLREMKGIQRTTSQPGCPPLLELFLSVP